MTLTIDRIDHENPAVKERLRTFLAPYEPHALFILGNLRSNRPDESPGPFPLEARKAKNATCDDRRV